MLEAVSATVALDDAARLRAGPAASWGAILAGAVVAVAISLILISLGAGLGFASLSPWADRGLSAHEFNVASTIWLIVTQWLSAAVGGYITGRLRHRWLATHVHEVFFRDTAHGLIAWALATLFVASVLASGLGSLGLGGARTLGGLTASSEAGPGAPGPGLGAGAGLGAGPRPGNGPGGGYDIDKLFRSTTATAADVVGPGPGAAGTGALGFGAPGVRAPEARQEALDIAAHAAVTGEVGVEDRAYLAYLVATRTGASPGETQKRVDAFIQSITDAHQKAIAAVDASRKSAASAALYTALALLIGAFIASVAAAVGGRLRDEHL
jgi:hypothetical protein